MKREPQSFLDNAHNEKQIYTKSNKKSNITLSIDTEILNMLKDTAEGEGLSINSKISSILWKYIFFYKYVEQDSSMVIPSRSVDFLIENIDEEKWIQEYNQVMDEIIPFFFLELQTIQTLENTLKVVFDRLLVYSGQYKGYSCHTSEDGYLNLVFRHEYGIKWSGILSAVYTRFIEKALNHPAYSLKVTDTWFAIKISDKISETTEHSMRI